VYKKYIQILLTSLCRVLAASMEINYILVLSGVAILWRPQANAKEYAYVMELPPMTAGDDEDDGEGGLELTGVVPSAVDDDDEPGISNDEFSDEPK
jgi:hypothetical protein